MVRHTKTKAKVFCDKFSVITGSGNARADFKGMVGPKNISCSKQKFTPTDGLEAIGKLNTGIGYNGIHLNYLQHA